MSRSLVDLLHTLSKGGTKKVSITHGRKIRKTPRKEKVHVTGDLCLALAAVSQKNPFAMMKAWQVGYLPKTSKKPPASAWRGEIFIIYVDPTGLLGILDIKDLVAKSQGIAPDDVYSIEEMDQSITPNAFRML